MTKQEKHEPATASGWGYYVAKYREFKYQETLFELAKVDELCEGAVFQVLDAAKKPDLKSEPKKAVIAIFAILTAGFALLFFVFIRQALWNGATDEETARKLAELRNFWCRALGRA